MACSVDMPLRWYGILLDNHILLWYFCSHRERTKALDI